MPVTPDDPIVWAATVAANELRALVEEYGLGKKGLRARLLSLADDLDDARQSSQARAPQPAAPRKAAD